MILSSITYSALAILGGQKLIIHFLKKLPIRKQRKLLIWRRLIKRQLQRDYIPIWKKSGSRVIMIMSGEMHTRNLVTLDFGVLKRPQSLKSWDLTMKTLRIIFTIPLIWPILKII